MKTIHVNIQHLEQAFGVDLQDIKQGDSVSKLFCMLGNRPHILRVEAIASSAKRKGATITILDDPYTEGGLDPEKKEKLLAWHQTYLRKQEKLEGKGA